MAAGDSGGPLLLEYGGEYLVAGVLSGGATFDSAYGDISHWTGVGAYREWIEANSDAAFVRVIPTPTAAGMILEIVAARLGLGRCPRAGS